jgi:hypothetical protein
MYAAITSIDQSRYGRTTMPEPRRGSTRLHSPSRRSASRSVGRLAPSWRLSSRSAGSRAPDGYVPRTMSASSFSNTVSIAVASGESGIEAVTIGKTNW